MSCEFINTKQCPIGKGLPAFQQNLGELAEIFTPKQIRKDFCNNQSDEVRRQYCPTVKRLEKLI